MILSPNIIQLLEKRCGHPISLPVHCSTLALDIESCTGEHIGVNTIKRLLGFINDERQPRESTLHIIANYLGYDSWETLKMIDEAQGNSDFNIDVEQVRLESLQIGDLIEITYSPNRRIVILYNGENVFTVKESGNSKLCVGDAITLSHIINGYPLLVAKVVREGKDLGQFVAGKAQGVKFKIL